MTAKQRNEPLTVDDLTREAKSKGLRTLRLLEQESDVESGALYVYDETALQEHLERNKSILEAAGWPTTSEAFIRNLVVSAPQKTPLFDVIADAFADYTNPQRLKPGTPPASIPAPTAARQKEIEGARAAMNAYFTANKARLQAEAEVELTVVPKQEEAVIKGEMKDRVLNNLQLAAAKRVIFYELDVRVEKEVDKAIKAAQATVAARQPPPPPARGSAAERRAQRDQLVKETLEEIINSEPDQIITLNIDTSINDINEKSGATVTPRQRLQLETAFVGRSLAVILQQVADGALTDSQGRAKIGKLAKTFSEAAADVGKGIVAGLKDEWQEAVEQIATEQEAKELVRFLKLIHPLTNITTYLNEAQNILRRVRAEQAKEETVEAPKDAQGMTAPLENPRGSAAKDVITKLVKNLPDITIIEADLKSATLVSTGHFADVYILTKEIDGQTRRVAVKVFKDIYAESDAWLTRELRGALILSQLGIGPEVFGRVGMTIGGQQRLGFVMEAVDGESSIVANPAHITQQTVDDVRRAVELLVQAGYAMRDFETMVTSAGRAVVIDAGFLNESPTDDDRRDFREFELRIVLLELLKAKNFHFGTLVEEVFSSISPAGVKRIAPTSKQVQAIARALAAGPLSSVRSRLQSTQKPEMLLAILNESLVDMFGALVGMDEAAIQGLTDQLLPIVKALHGTYVEQFLTDLPTRWSTDTKGNDPKGQERTTQEGRIKQLRNEMGSVMGVGWVTQQKYPDVPALQYWDDASFTQLLAILRTKYGNGFSEIAPGVTLSDKNRAQLQLELSAAWQRAKLPQQILDAQQLRTNNAQREIVTTGLQAFIVSQLAKVSALGMAGDQHVLEALKALGAALGSAGLSGFERISAIATWQERLRQIDASPLSFHQLAQIYGAITTARQTLDGRIIAVERAEEAGGEVEPKEVEAPAENPILDEATWSTEGEKAYIAFISKAVKLLQEGTYDAAITLLSEDEAKGVAKGVGFELADDARGEIYHKEDLAGKTQMIANRQAYNSMFHMSGRIQLGWVSGNLTNNQKNNIALVYLEEWLHGLQELRAKNNPDNSNISNRGQREGTIDHEADVALFMSEQGIPLADVFVSRYGRSAYVSAAAKQNGTSRIIGRGDETDFRLPSVLPKVSRQHARIYYQNGAWYIEDLKSTNGTFVNGKKISGSQKIINGDTVSLADVVFTVKVSNDTVTLTDQTGVLGSLSISDTGAITSTIEERKMHDFSTVGSTKNYNPASPVNQRIALGRQPQGSNDALFTDSSVSRRHAELYVANGKWAVLDTGSGNGTFVNGGRIGEGYEVVARMLNNGDTIRLGQEVFLKIAIGKNNILTLTRVVAPAARPELLPSGQALMKLMEFDGDPDILTAQVGGLLAQEIAPYVQQLKPGTSIAKQQEIFTKIEAVLRTYDAQAKKDSGRVRSDLERSIALVRDILADAGFIDPATGKKAISKAGLIDLLIPSFKGNVPDWVRDTIDVFIDAHPGLALANRLYQAPENIDELKNTLKEFLQEVNKALTPYSKLPKVFNGIVSSAQFVIQTFPRSPTVWSPSFASIQAAKTHLTEAQQAISGKELDKARILLSKADKEIPPDSPLRPAIGDEYKAAQQALQRASAPEKPPEAPAEEARTIFELVNARTTDFTITISPDQVPAQLKLLIQQFAPIMKLVPSDIQVSATFDPSTQTWNVIGNISSREQTIELSLIPDEKNGFAFLKKELTGFGGLTFIIKVALTPKRALDLLNKKDPDVQKLDAYHKITRLALDASGNIILSGTTQTAPRTLEAPGLLTQLDEVAETAVVAVTKLAPETKASVVANLRILAKDIRAFETQGRTRDEALGEVLKKFHSDPFFQNYGLVKGYFFLHLSDPESYPLNIVGRGLSRTSTDKIRAWMVDQSEKKRELGLVQMEWLRELLDRFGIQLSLNELSLDHYPLIVGDNATFDQYGFGNDVVAFYDERLGLYVLRDRVTLSQAQRDKLDAIIFRILSHEVSHDMLRAYGPWMNDTGSEGLATGLMVMLEVFANNTSWEAAEQIIRGTVSSGYWSKYLFLRSQGSSPLGDLITRALAQGDDQRVAEGLLRFWQTTKDVKPVEGRIGRHGVAVVLGRHMIEAFGEMLNLTPEQTAGQRNLLTAFFEESLLNETPDQPFVRAVNVSASFSPEEMAQAQQALIEKVATLTVDDYAPDSPWAGWQDFVTALQHGSPIENALRQDVLNALVPIEGIFARARITERQGLPVDNTQADVEALFTKLLDRYAHVPFDRAVMSDLGGGTVFINQIIVTRGSTDIKTAWTEYVAKHGIDINASPSYLHPIRVPREGEVVDESKLEPVTSIHPDVFKWYTNALFVILKQPNPLNRNEETGEFVETEIARLFGTEDFGGPAFYGVVKRIDGSEAYAIEFLPDVITVKMSGGKLALEPPIDNPGMSDGEMRRRITPQVASQMWARFKQVLLAGYYPDDFQVLVDGAGRVYLFDPGEYKLLSQFFPNIALTEEGVEDFYRNFLSKTVFGSSFAELNKLAERNEEQYSLTVPVQSGGLALAAIPIATKVVRGGVVLVDSALNHPSWWQGMVAAARNVDDFVWSPVNRLVRQIYVDLRERFPESTALSRLAGVIPQAPSIVWFPGGANVSDIQPEDEAPETISDPLAQKRADERRLFEEGLRSLTESWQSLTNALTSGKTIGEFSISRALSQKLINDITLLEGRIQLSNKLKTSGQGTLTEADIRRYLEVMQRAYQGLTVDNVFKDAQARNSPLTREMIAQYEVDIEEFRTHFDDFLSSHLRMRELTNVQQLETEDGTVSIRDIWERMLREAGKTTQSTVPADYYERSKPEVLTFTTDGQERDVMLPVVAHSELRRTSDPKRVRARVIPVVHEMQFNDNNEPMYPFIVNELFFEDTSQTYQPVARHFDEITDITDALGLGYADFEFFGIGPFGEEVWGIILEEQTSAGWDRLESPPGPGTGGGEQPEETGYQRLERLIEDQRKDFQHYRTSKSDNRSTRLGDKYSTWLREYDRELFDAVVTEQNAPDQNPTPLDDFIGKKMPPNLLPTWKDMLQEGTGTGGEGQTRVEELQAMIGRQERNFSNLDATLGLEIAKKEKASVILDQDLGYTLLVLHRAILNAQKAGEITQEQKQELVMEVLRMVRRKYNMWLRGSY
ncbi:MAG: hypothetical protein UY16_C0013G0044, partial [Candidatus Gottesmanbacteria bacterium GW2011_GWA2_47_9]